ncbi:hypothetical protein OG948_49760 (plasmid) [Embleya sp. NBC_00888]|uniref:hypothetical protein n=1 Tax=Embleya sp. NBC_00888 TaxID=2975960 RepID=UPI002F90FFD0|nr:hypothetical protein OG948_49760 [Embleya sp. NBC_00888]
MTPHEASLRSVHHAGTPASRRGSPAAPIIATILTVPVAGAHLFLFGLSAMAFDSCNSAADCPEATAAVNRAAWLAVASVPVALTSWLWPHKPRFNRYRVAHLGVYLVLAGTAGALFVTVPVGR